MKSYVVFVMQQVDCGWVEEGRVEISHGLAPQFALARKGLLNQQQVSSLLYAAWVASDGRGERMDLKEFKMMVDNQPSGDGEQSQFDFS